MVSILYISHLHLRDSKCVYKKNNKFFKRIDNLKNNSFTFRA